MSQIDVDNPLKWLLAELPAYLSVADHIELMERYEANKQRYYDAVKVRDLERKIKFAARWPPSDNQAERITRWQAQLERLKVRSE